MVSPVHFLINKILIEKNFVLEKWIKVRDQIFCYLCHRQFRHAGCNKAHLSIRNPYLAIISSRSNKFRDHSLSYYWQRLLIWLFNHLHRDCFVHRHLNNVWYNKANFLIGKEYLAIIASNAFFAGNITLWLTHLLQSVSSVQVRQSGTGTRFLTGYRTLEKITNHIFLTFSEIKEIKEMWSLGLSGFPCGSALTSKTLLVSKWLLGELLFF